MYQLDVLEAPVTEDLKNWNLIDGEIIQSNRTREVFLVTSEKLIGLRNPFNTFDRAQANDYWSFRRFPQGTKLTLTL